MNRIVIVYESPSKLETYEQCEAFAQQIIAHFKRGGYEDTGGTIYMGQTEKTLRKGDVRIRVVVDESDEVDLKQYPGHKPSIQFRKRG